MQELPIPGYTQVLAYAPCTFRKVRTIRGCLGEEDREECEKAIRTRRDWVVWSLSRPMKVDGTFRGFEHVGKAIFCGQVNRRKKEHESPGAEDEAENDTSDNEVGGGGRAGRQKGWWKRGDVEAKLNTVNMTVWVHKECVIIEEEALTKLQEAWDSSEQKDECTVCLDDLERAYWIGTEVGLLGGYGFQGVTLGVDGSCKDGKMGSGCCKFKEEGADKCARGGREEEGISSHRPELGWIVLALAGRATFLIKVKSHRGEPINERADSLAEKGRETSHDNKRWDERTNWMTFEVRKGDTTVRSVWTNSVRNAFRKQAGRAKLQEARAVVARHWTERVWYRHNQHWLQATREGTEASKRGGFKNREWGKKCFEDDDVFFIVLTETKTSLRLYTRPSGTPT
jgi:hypothetical protein